MMKRMINDFFYKEDRKKLVEKYCSKGKGLDLGSYQEKLTGKNAKGVDLKKNKNVSIVHDLNKLFNFVKKNSQDFIFAGEVIEHLYNPDIFLRECKKILKKDGLIVVTTWNARSLVVCKTLDHKYSFMLNHLENLMSKHFEIVEKGYINVFKKNLIFRFFCHLFKEKSWFIYVVGKKKRKIRT